jgi:curved DNA-binding protein CbpA
MISTTLPLVQPGPETVPTNNILWGQEQQQDNGRSLRDGDEYDPYHILHVRRDATNHEMKRAYQQLALLYHPTLVTVQKQEELSLKSIQDHKHFLFTIISASYETLSVTETRHRMDSILMQQQHAVRSGHSFSINQKDKSIRTSTSPKWSEGNKHHMMVISKEEQKVRKQIQDERRVHQQEQRDSKNCNKKKKRQIPTMIKNFPRSSLLSTTSSYQSNVSHNPASFDEHSNNSATGRKNKKEQTIIHNNINGDYNKDEAIPSSSLTTTHKVEEEQCGRMYQQHERGYNWRYCAPSCYAASDDNSRDATTPSHPKNDPHYSCTSKLIHRSNNKNQHSWNHMKHKKNVIPPLLLSSDSEDSDNESNGSERSPQHAQQQHQNHNNTSDTERWFGGPLKLMYRARRFQPFTDPLILFERIFHSGLLQQKQYLPMASLGNHNNVTQGPYLPTITMGSAFVPMSTADDTIETLHDGTIITRAHRSRNQFDTTNGQYQAVKTISRTVKRYPPDPVSGQRRTIIHVTSDYDFSQSGMDDPRIESSSTNFIECFGWMNRKSECIDDYGNDRHSLTSTCQSWLPHC